MNGRVPNHSGTSTQRTHAKPAVAPIARAIRKALAVSAIALSLTVPTANSLASECRYDANTISTNATSIGCASEADFALREDPSIVSGGLSPTAVHAAGSPDPHSTNSGSDVAWHADPAEADVFPGFDSIDDLSLVTGFAIPDPVSPRGVIDVVLDGVIDDISVDGDALGFGAFDDEVSVHNTGSIGAHGYNSAIGIDASGSDAYIRNDGTIFAETVHDGGYAPAVGVRASGDLVHVVNGADGLFSANATADDGRARARAIYAMGFTGGVTVDNDGELDAFAQAHDGRAEAHGVYAFGYGGPTTVTNAGDIDSHAVANGGGAYATGINAIGYGSGNNLSQVVNTGSITAIAEGDYAYSFGVFNLTRQRYGSAETTNDGDIDSQATGNYATANGIINLALRYGNATTTNTGDIVSVANGGAGGSATGIYNHAYVYDSVVDNSGTIDVVASGDRVVAVGIYSGAGFYGDAAALNTGTVSVLADGGDAFARAVGMAAMSENSAELVNYGTIDVTTNVDNGPATAAGMYGVGSQAVTIRNYGDVAAIAHSGDGDAYAYGALAFGGSAGTALLINGGDLHAEASATNGTAYAVGGFVTADVASIFNDGGATAIATAIDGDAIAKAAWALGRYGAVNNYGTLVASAYADGGDASARGAETYGYLGATTTNAGDIQADATSIGGLANAVGAYTLASVFTATTDNTGGITAIATGDSASANGVVNVATYFGDAITTNTGDIAAHAVGGIAGYGETEALAFGVYNLAMIYDSIVDNDGSIFASATATADIAIGDGFLQAQAIGAAALNTYGFWSAGIVNSGSIGASADTSLGYASAWGVAVQSSGAYGGEAWVDNTGLITAYAHADIGVAVAIAVYAFDAAGDTTVVNRGDIVATARAERGIVDVVTDYAEASGVQAVSFYGDTVVANYANIEAHAEGWGAIVYAHGIQAGGANTTILNAAGATILATAELDVFGGGYARGIEASGTYGVDVTNAGDIVAYGSSHGLAEGPYATFISSSGATGIAANAGFQGDVSVTNTGDISAVAVSSDSITFFNGLSGATGIDAYAKYDASVVNHGDILASASTDIGLAVAYGVFSHGKYSGHVENGEGASIVALAEAGSLATDQNGGRAFAAGVRMFRSDHGYVTNDGLIVAHATVTADGVANADRSLADALGISVGYNSVMLTADVVNRGDVEAVASADFGYATAYGTYVRAQYESTTTNDGSILAIANAANGDAFAVGSHGYSLHQSYYVECDAYGCDWGNGVTITDDGVATLDNTGTIAAVANAVGGVGRSYGAAMMGAFSARIGNAGDLVAVTEADEAHATGAVVSSFYGDATLVNTGLVTAEATGASATATGAQLLGAIGADGVAVIVDNQGRIQAVARGDLANAVGVTATGGVTDGVWIDNAGTILAAAYGADASAIAVSMDSTGTNTLFNTGTIAALGDGTRIAISSSDGAVADLTNLGTIRGAIVTGDLDDVLANGAGATWHAVGASDFGGGADRVSNLGTIFLDNATVRLGAAGEGDFLDNGGIFAVRGASTLELGGAFRNDGILRFIDGIAGDTLHVTGDFTGHGVIGFDIDGTTQSGDWLRIDGNVDAASMQTLDVNFTDLPTSASFLVPLVNVSGDATAGNFALGDVWTQGGFLSLDFSLAASIDATNAHDDVFSLGVEVTGLSDTGSLAAAIAPGMQSLVDAQVGSFRQRNGALPQGEGRISPWARVFADGGDMDLRHDANFGLGGDFAFHQSNQGWEVGIEARATDQVSLGLLFASSQGDQNLAGAGGANRLEARTVGVFGTWRTDGGFYVDVSQRWSGLEARLSTSTGDIDTHGNASAFNVEAGIAAWNVGGFRMTPQLQYTHTRIEDIEAVHVGAATFVDDGGVSSRARLGVAFDKTVQAGAFVLMPYGSLNVVREFAGNYDYAVNGSLLGTSSARGTGALVEVGLGARWKQWTFTGSVNRADGGALDEVIGSQITARIDW